MAGYDGPTLGMIAPAFVCAAGVAIDFLADFSKRAQMIHFISRSAFCLAFAYWGFALFPNSEWLGAGILILLGGTGFGFALARLVSGTSFNSTRSFKTTEFGG
jgi:hypothetical protein